MRATGPTSIQFVAVADPVKTTWLDIIKRDKIEISRYTVKVLDTQLIESGEEVLGNVDSLVAHVAVESAELVVGGTLDVSQLIITCGSSGNVYSWWRGEEVHGPLKMTVDKPIVRSDFGGRSD